MILAGLRKPAVAILVAIAFFTAISGKPVDGVLMLIVAMSLAWDAGRRARVDGTEADGRGTKTDAGGAADSRGAANGSGAADAARTAAAASAAAASTADAASPLTASEPAATASPAPGGSLAASAASPAVSAASPAAGAASPAAGAASPAAGAASPAAGAASPAVGTRYPAGAGSRRAWSGHKLVLAVVLLAGGAAYAGVVGTFSRYSWPATAGIIVLGTVVVLVGWHGPVTRRPVPGRLPATGTALWGLLLVIGGLWELSALLKQPTLTQTSYAHPTISALTDPVLATAGGRSTVLAAWLLIGWYLVRR